MYKNKVISLILPAYNEKESIYDVITGFSKLRLIDEIIVVDNNSKDETAKIARSTKMARVIKESKQGYGYAIQKGLSYAKGDLLITCDADSTYRPKDIIKLIEKSGDFDFVFATRVINGDLSKGSNMTLIRRAANIFLSKVIQIIFKGSCLTDLGSTFRLINRNAYKKIKNQFTIGGGEFQPELTILALKNGFTIGEVPVYYGSRKGVSKISGSLWGGIKTAVKMFRVITRYTLANNFLNAQ